MITLRIGKFGLHIHWSFWLLLGVAAQLPGSRLLLLSLGAACCHEVGHLAAMLAAGIPPRSLCLTALGGRLQAGSFYALGAELAALGAGAAVNLILAACFARATAYSLRLFSAVNLLLGVFNILPVQGLDGGRMAALLAEHKWGPVWSNRLSLCLSAVTLVLLFCWSFLLWKGHRNLPGILLIPLAPGAAFWGWLRQKNH